MARVRYMQVGVGPPASYAVPRTRIQKHERHKLCEYGGARIVERVMVSRQLLLKVRLLVLEDSCGCRRDVCSARCVVGMTSRSIT